ncbi:MAG: molybdopterin-dependent oxidoreductase [Kiloniellaceae bacterium]
MWRVASDHVFARVALATLVLAVMSGLVLPAEAAPDLPRPQGEVVLVVTGNIAHKNSAAGAEFDLAMLEGLGTTALRTSTPWTDGVPMFKGVLAREVLRRVGARGTRVRAIALNEYAFEMPVSDFDEYPVILASEMNGEALTARDKGPLWIVYPLDQIGAGRNRSIEHRMVWQLVELHVR